MILGWCLTTVVDNLITQYTYCIPNFLLNGSNLDMLKAKVSISKLHKHATKKTSDKHTNVT